MATGLKYYFGIDFGTTNSATVGYVVMDQKPEAVKYGDEEGVRFRPLLRLIKPQALYSLAGMHGIRRWS